MRWGFISSVEHSPSLIVRGYTHAYKLRLEECERTRIGTSRKIGALCAEKVTVAVSEGAATMIMVMGAAH